MGKLFDEFHVGQRFRTPGRTVVDADLVAFASLTGDWNPVHCDHAFAQATEFGSVVAHGPMSVGILFGLASRLDLIDGTVVALLGLQWDFRAPVRPGDTVAALIEVAAMRPSTRQPDRGVLIWNVVIENQHAEPTQTGTVRLLMRRQPHPAASWGELTT